MTEKYRKKPAEVEVMRYDKRNYRAALVFAPNVAGFDWLYEKLTLKTLEGELTVSDGDYIIKGVQGEFYPCKPDIFHETYEPVSDHQPTFAVGEYYSFTTYRKDYDADTTFIIKVLEIKGCGIRVIEYDIHGRELGEYVYDADSDFLKEAKLATAEQIAEFKRAEHFASKVRSR